jgi:hypothetical protein
LQFWIELITNQALTKNLGLKNLRIAVMNLSFALHSKHKQLLSLLDEYHQNARDELKYVGEWTTPESDYIFKFKMRLKIKGSSKEETKTVPIEGYILWLLTKAPENSFFRHVGHSGREFVEGTFQRDQRHIECHGVRLDASATGWIGLDQYRFTISNDEQSFEGVTYGNDQLWANIIRGKTEEAVRRDTIEEYIKLYHQSNKQQSNYSFMHDIDAILLNI